MGGVIGRLTSMTNRQLGYSINVKCDSYQNLNWFSTRAITIKKERPRASFLLGGVVSAQMVSMKLRSLSLRLGCFNLRKALASI